MESPKSSAAWISLQARRAELVREAANAGSRREAHKVLTEVMLIDELLKDL